MSDFSDLCLAVTDWADSKGILKYEPTQSLVQLGKTKEELEELIQAIQHFRAVDPTDLAALAKTSNDVVLELGDVMVTLVIAAECMGLDITDCLNAAYLKISKRTGRTINGIFVKD